jgi:hypothetical protein
LPCAKQDFRQGDTGFRKKILPKQENPGQLSLARQRKSDAADLSAAARAKLEFRPAASSHLEPARHAMSEMFLDGAA